MSMEAAIKIIDLIKQSKIDAMNGVTSEPEPLTGFQETCYHCSTCLQLDNECCNCKVKLHQLNQVFCMCTGIQKFHYGTAAQPHCSCQCDAKGCNKRPVSEMDTTLSRWHGRMRLDLVAMLATFYVLNELDTLPVSMQKSHEKWKSDLRDYTADFNKLFATVLYEYIIAACFGEARYISSESKAQWTEALPARRVEEYAPAPVAARLEELFNNYKWAPSYGGEAWGTIAKAAVNYASPNVVAWIDHVVDLGHNNGCFFDKGKNLACDVQAVKKTLDFKREHSMLRDRFPALVSFETYALVERAKTLKLLQEANPYIVVAKDFNHEPITWGSLLLPALRTNPLFIGDSNRDDNTLCCEAGHSYNPDYTDTCDNDTDYCLEHCSCDVCSNCDSHVDTTCNTCEYCMDCCDCVSCRSCSTAGNSEAVCVSCMQCDECCDCWTCDECEETMLASDEEYTIKNFSYCENCYNSLPDKDKPKHG